MSTYPTQTEILAEINGPLRPHTLTYKSIIFLNWEMNQPRPAIDTAARAKRLAALSERAKEAQALVAAWAEATGRTGGRWKMMRRSRNRTLLKHGMECELAKAMRAEMGAAK